MQEEMYHMSALDIHGEGQLEAVTIWGGGGRKERQEKNGRVAILWLGGD